MMTIWLLLVGCNSLTLAYDSRCGIMIWVTQLDSVRHNFLLACGLWHELNLLVRVDILMIISLRNRCFLLWGVTDHSLPHHLLLYLDYSCLWQFRGICSA